jgi:prephenate dehydratase
VPRVAYLGPQGTFTEAALLQMAAGGAIPGAIPDSTSDLEPISSESPAAALAAVRTGDADFACVPIENSIEGSVLPTLDSLATGDPLQIYAQHTLDVAFGIVVRPGTAAARLDRPPSRGRRPVRRWLADHLPQGRVVPAISTAAAAHDVSHGRADAGVSTALAAERYGLTVLATDVVDEPNARTRFVLAGQPGPPPDRTGADRTSVVLRLDNVPGALVSAMTEFAIRDIDLTRIESRPTRIELGTYVFFLDCVGHIDDDAVAQALKALHRRCRDVRYLGSWPTGAAGGGAAIDGRCDTVVDGAPGGSDERALVLLRHEAVTRQRGAPPRHAPTGRGAADLGHQQAVDFARTGVIRWDGGPLGVARHRDRGPHRRAAGADPHRLEGIREYRSVSSRRTATTRPRSSSSTPPTSAGTKAISTSRYPAASRSTAARPLSSRGDAAAPPPSRRPRVDGDIVMVSPAPPSAW